MDNRAGRRIVISHIIIAPDEHRPQPESRECVVEARIDDMAWCWWTRPRATRIDHTLYLGAVDSAGCIVAATWDLVRRVSDRTRMARFEADDHNNPALVAAPGRPLVAFYSRHAEDDAVRYRVSRRPTDISEWTEEKVLRFGGPTTYAEVHPLGSELHLFTRVDETGWSYRRSPDWASTWEEPRPFLSFQTDQQVYMATALLPDGRTVRVAVSGHPKEYGTKPLHDIWVCLVDLASGAVTNPSDPTALANLRTGDGLPLNHDRLELAYRTPGNRTVNLFDVGDAPAFEVAFVSKLKGDADTVDARYHTVTAHRDGWLVEDIVDAGGTFGYIPAGFYVGGMAFPSRTPGGRVYLSREAGGVWHLERWDRGPDGGWMARPVCAPGPTRLVRPWPVTDPDGGVDLLALALDRYDGSYFDTRSHLVGWRGPA
jgi:BNR repeat-containing family member